MYSDSKGRLFMKEHEAQEYFADNHKQKFWSSHTTFYVGGGVSVCE